MEQLSTIFLFGIASYFNSLILLSFLFGAVGISSYYYNRARGSNQADSVNAAMMIIFLIIGLLLFYIGAYFVTNPDNLLTQDLGSSGWGLIGFGFSIIALSLSYLSNIESQRNIEQIKIFLFKGRRFTRNYHDILNSKELFRIAKIWYIFTVLTWIYCYIYRPDFIFFPILVMYFMLLMSVGTTLLAVYRDNIRKQKVKRIVKIVLLWARRQLIKYCIFCYLFPNRFPEIFDN